MKRLAGTTAAYALTAALLLATPLSASEDPVLPEAPQVTAPAATDAQPVVTEPVPEEPAPTEPATPAAEAPPPAQPPAAKAPPPKPLATTQVIDEKTEPQRSGRAPRATAAADTTVTISDFQFAPSAVTIDVGDTVTWRNEGPTPHSATADDGSFDTGVYERGQSRSHTFGEAGTFAYFCTPHPNMRGTVTVRAASGGGSGGGGSGGGSGGGDAGSTGGGDAGSTAGESAGTGTASGESGDSSGAALPATGFDTGGLAALGLVTIALGAWLGRWITSGA